VTLAEEYDKKARDITYPERPKKPARENFSSHADYGAALDIWEREREQYKERERAYREEQGRVMAEFRAAVAAELGLTGHPKFDALYDIAWSHGHSSGFSEVYYWCDELAPLIRD
jgi:hypothetical protein